MLHALLDVYAEEELWSDYGTSPQMGLVTPHVDIDEVVGVVPGVHRRKRQVTDLQAGSMKLAEVYKLLREQTEGAGEIRLPSTSSGSVADGEDGWRDTLEVYGNLGVGTWDYEKMWVPLGLLDVTENTV
jgi:hypothetical protein